MKRLLSLLLIIPIAIVVVSMAVANREYVSINFPPELGYEPVQVPMYVLWFSTLFLGMLLGSFVTWLSQGKYRRQARLKGKEVKKISTEAEKQKERADQMAADIVNDAANDEKKAFSALGLPPPKKAA